MKNVRVLIFSIPSALILAAPSTTLQTHLTATVRRDLETNHWQQRSYRRVDSFYLHRHYRWHRFWSLPSHLQRVGRQSTDGKLEDISQDSGTLRSLQRIIMCFANNTFLTVSLHFTFLEIPSSIRAYTVLEPLNPRLLVMYDFLC